MSPQELSQLPPDIQQQIASLLRQRNTSANLAQMGMAPTPNEVINGRVIPQGGGQILAKVLSSYFGNKGMEKADEGIAGIKQKDAADYSSKAAALAANPSEAAIAQALASNDPRYAALAASLKKEKARPMVVGPGASVYDPDSKGSVFTNPAIEKPAPRAVLSDIGRLLEEQKAFPAGSREWNLIEERIKRLNSKSDGLQVSFGGLVPVIGPDGQPALAQPNNRGGAQIVPGIYPVPKEPTPKTVPASVAKLQDGLLEDIGLASGIAVDLTSLDKQISSGDLSFGPIDNLVSKVLNDTGNSTEASRNSQTAMATLEKMRNDSLRLNKGTQTEGDAVRAWTENFPSLGDTKAVSQRLQQIAAFNERALKEKKARLAKIRADYGQGEIDTKEFEVTTPVIGDAPKKRIKYDAQGNQLP